MDTSPSPPSRDGKQWIRVGQVIERWKITNRSYHYGSRYLEYRYGTPSYCANDCQQCDTSLIRILITKRTCSLFRCHLSILVLTRFTQTAWYNALSGTLGHFPNVSTAVASQLSLEGHIFGPFYHHGLTLIPSWISYHLPSKIWMKLLIHTETLMVASLKFGNGYIITSRM